MEVIHDSTGADGRDDRVGPGPDLFGIDNRLLTISFDRNPYRRDREMDALIGKFLAQRFVDPA